MDICWNGTFGEDAANVREYSREELMLSREE